MRNRDGKDIFNIVIWLLITLFFLNLLLQFAQLVVRDVTEQRAAEMSPTLYIIFLQFTYDKIDKIQRKND